MTVGGLVGQPWLGRVVAEGAGGTPEAEASGITVEGGPVDKIHEDLSAGANVAMAGPLKSNDGLSSPGVKLHGAGFIVTPGQWDAWGQPPVIHPYRNGRDLTDRPRGVMVIDLYGLTEAEVMQRFPPVYQHVRETVKPERDQNNDQVTRRNWWIFGRNREDIRPALKGLPRYIATVETAKHRVFQFLDGTTLPDNMLIAIASDDGFHLGVLSSRIHVIWALAAGGVLEDRPRYNKSRCFDTFPFPQATKEGEQEIRSLAERLDAHRKAAQGRGVTITGMYNLLAKMRAGEPFTPQERAQHEAAQTEVLRQLHDGLDAAVAAAYGWPLDMPEEAVLDGLVSLNKARAMEEAGGWFGGSAPTTRPPRLPSRWQFPCLRQMRRPSKPGPPWSRSPGPGTSRPSFRPCGASCWPRGACGAWRRWPRPSAAVGDTRRASPGPPGPADGPWYGEPRRNCRWPQVAPPPGDERMSEVSGTQGPSPTGPREAGQTQGEPWRTPRWEEEYRQALADNPRLAQAMLVMGMLAGVAGMVMAGGDAMGDSSPWRPEDGVVTF